MKIKSIVIIGFGVCGKIEFIFIRALTTYKLTLHGRNN